MNHVQLLALATIRVRPTPWVHQRPHPWDKWGKRGGRMIETNLNRLNLLAPAAPTSKSPSTVDPAHIRHCTNSAVFPIKAELPCASCSEGLSEASRSSSRSHPPSTSPHTFRLMFCTPELALRTQAILIKPPYAYPINRGKGDFYQ